MKFKHDLTLISENVETFYHHAFVAEGVNIYDENDKVYFVAQFHEGEVIPEEDPDNYARHSNDLQVCKKNE